MLGVAYVSGDVGVEILVFVCYNIVGFNESCKTICWLTASEKIFFGDCGGWVQPGLKN
jgi:hypothetical protein